MEGTEIFDLSGDFNDALSVAENDRNYMNKINSNSNNNDNNSNNNNNANIQPIRCITTQCLVEEQQQRCRDAEQFLIQQSPAVAQHPMLQTAYQQPFQNQNQQFLPQQQQQQQQQLRNLINQRQIQQQNQVQHVHNHTAQMHETVPQIQNQAVHQTVPQMQNQLAQVRQAAPQMPNQLSQVRQAVPQIQNQATQVHQAEPQMQNQVAQVQQAVPQVQNPAAQVQAAPRMPNQFSQVRQAVLQIQNQATKVGQAVPQMQNQTAQMQQAVPQVQNPATQVRQAAPQMPNQLSQAVPQIQNQETQIRQVVPQLQNQAVQAHQAAQFQQSQAHQQNHYQQAQLPNQQTQQTLNQYQQQLLAAAQQLYGSSSQAQNQQQQQQTPRNFAPPAAPNCTPQNAFQLIPPQRQLQPQQETTVQQNLSVVQQTAPEPTVQIPQSKPYVEIVEQPAARGSRFRYGCEVRSSGSIPGINSTPDNKTYPTIRVVGYNGEAVIVVSCVTRDKPYRAHPHNLVGKVLCKSGICKATMSKDNMTVSFDKLGIQCIKKKDVLKSLNQREKIQVDPFKNGFDYKNDPGSFDQNCVRLAFQVFLEGPSKGQYKIPLPPVVSDPIYDKKSSPDLTIYKLSHFSAPASGFQEMILLCDKVAKEDIQVRFYEERDDELVWEGFASLSKTNAVHKHVAILFQCPKYRVTEFTGEANVYIELVRPSDGLCSNSVLFTFIPANDPIEMKKKRKRVNDSITESFLMKNLEHIAYADQWNITNQTSLMSTS